ncbi:unnamed protein product [Sphenostylis stenocarpa]|uniref:Protein kinase domain-containing protein n=1 Tax=Sphenostylis stenocarpa TaxID=92480 RepID=A0AA86VC61_9FABA|nr:unnamed protein product [Sphenostylis stenocarpa]
MITAKPLGSALLLLGRISRRRNIDRNTWRSCSQETVFGNAFTLSLSSVSRISNLPEFGLEVRGQILAIVHVGLMSRSSNIHELAHTFLDEAFSSIICEEDLVWTEDGEKIWVLDQLSLEGTLAPELGKLSFDEKDINQNLINLVNLRRKLLDQSSNLAAAPFSDGPTIQITPIPITQSSGAFPAFRERQISAQYPSPSTFPFVDQTIPQNSTNGANGRLWKYTIIAAGLAVLFSVVLIMLLIWRKRAAKVIKPWKSGISGELQKAFITGVPKLNLAELETACEDFSNIINSFEGCTIYKGTLSSGVEIAVHSTILTSASYWSKNMEMAYRKKIATLSRLNHKNFTNLIGYCDEEQPFKRMMVFDYDSNGSLFEHLHVKEAEHLDWDTRMRVIMGTVYCLHYMHHDLNPPVAHSNLTSISILLTDDFAAKISEFAFDRRVLHCAAADESHKAELPPHPDPETDVYNFGVLLLEIISGKLPYSEQEGHLVNWAVEHLNDKQSAKNMIDPSLESFKEEDLDVICEVIKACLQSDGRLRPTMMDLTLRLREVLHVSPEQAVPRLSPLWWAELEILSLETT